MGVTAAGGMRNLVTYMPCLVTYMASINMRFLEKICFTCMLCRRIFRHQARHRVGQLGSTLENMHHAFAN